MAVSIKGKVKASFLSAGNSARERSDGAGGGVRSGMSGMGALYRKEMSDHIHSKRFLIVLLLILLTSCASITERFPASPQRRRLTPATSF